jgi:DNA polymerase-3 subunit beta
MSERAWVGGKIEKEGGLCVSSRLLTEFVLTLPKDTVRLTASEGSLRVLCGKFDATIPGVAAAEFPAIPAFEAKKAPRLDKNAFIAALGGVLFASATDEGRPLLTGVKFAKDGEDVTIAATDGYRLSVKRVPLGVKGDLNMIVPARALGEIVKISLEEKAAEDLVFGKTEDNQLIFALSDAEIHTRVIDGDYPEYEKIIPKTHTTRALLDTEELTNAVKSAAIFARDSANIVRMNISGQTVTISANAATTGENKVDVEAKVDGEGGDIAFNSRFLLEFLTNFSQPELLFEMTGTLNPGVFRPVKDASYLHVIMPVRVQS